MRLSAIVAAHVVATTLSAEAGLPGPRRPVRGVVRDLAGEPWRGATVVLVSSPSAESTWARDVDRVEARPDERGRFRAEVLANRAYAAWAWQDQDDLVYRVTRVAGNVTAGVLLHLDESPRRQVRGPFRLEGVAAWKAVGLRAFLISDVHGDVPGSMLELTAALHVRDDGTGRLPRWPVAAASLQVLAANGAWPGHTRLDLSHDHLRNLIAAGTYGEGSATEVFERATAVTLKPPATGLLEVVSDDGPVAGAGLFLRWRDGSYLLGTTGAHGRCRVHLPMRTSGNKRIQVGRGSYGLWVGTMSPTLAAGLDVPAGDLRPTVLRVELGRRLSGRLMLGGEPMPDTEFLFYGQHGRSLSNDFAPSLLRTDAAGRFEIACLRSSGRYTIRALLGPEQLARVRGAEVGHMASVVPLAVGQLPNADRDLGEVHVDELPRVSLQIVEADGLPADRPTVVVERRHMPRFAPFRVAGDKRGRVTLIVPPEVELVVRAGWRGGFATTTFRSPRSGTRRIRAVGIAPRTITGRVVDGSGGPVAHALVEARSEGRRSHSFLFHTTTWTDVSGRFEIRLPDADSSWSVTATGYAGGLPVRVVGGGTHVEPNDDTHEVELVLEQ